MFSAADKQKMLHLFEQGKTYREIGKMYGISKDAVRGILRRTKRSHIDSNSLTYLRIQSERRKLQQEKADLKKLIREYATFEQIIEHLDCAISKLPALNKPAGNFVHPSTNQQLVMLISDLHLGEKSDTLGIQQYSSDTISERLAKYFSECELIAKEHNISVINLAFLGDLIEGHNIFPAISAYSDTDPIDQCVIVAELLANLINNLSQKCFINIYYVFGNHGRLSNTLQHTTNFEKLIIKYIQSRLFNNTNVKIHDSNGVFTIMTVLNWKYLLYHGDQFRDKENGSLRLKDILNSYGDDFDEIIVGHYHHFYEKELFAKGGSIIQSGSFTGGNEYSLRKLQCLNKPSQIAFIVDEIKGRWATFRIKV